MKKSSLVVLSAMLLVCLLVDRTLACTTFCLKKSGEVLSGGNYDWVIGDGLVFVNKRGVQKQATVEESANPATWVSRYGSVTFNQYGRENPTGGMNEAGLVVEVMWLAETEYPKEDARPTLGSQEWVQYQLDTSASVREVIRNARRVRITAPVKIHYLVSDRAGNAATIEFVKGRLVVHAGASLAVSVLTNDTYEKSLGYARRVDPEKATSDGSLDRFARTVRRTQEFGKQAGGTRAAVAYAFETLRGAAQKNWTQWSIVYDQRRRHIYFRTLQSPQIKMVDAQAFDYSCGTTVKIFDMNSKESGNVTSKFTDYTRQANRD
ncbi:MAG TPA: linear amide C-N hydrolase, partial [Pyrinomonadaceae bacterium]|nr:linear amide C-N hydrolase [Pyrinomonadaceae bacterium]